MVTLSQTTTRAIQTTRIEGSTTKWDGKVEIGIAMNIGNGKGSKAKIPGKVGKVDGGASGWVSIAKGSGDDLKKHDTIS